MALPQPRPGILEIEPYVGGKAKLAAGGQVARLASNESPLGPSPLAAAAYQDAAAELHRYPDGGCSSLREVIARRHNLDPGTIICGAGSDELIALLIKAYAGPGDEVVHSRHGFLMYRLSALAAGAHPVSAPEAGLKANVDALLAAVTSRTRLVFLANPNNPTGSYLGTAEIERLRLGLRDDIVLVIDAAYAEYVDEADYASGLEQARSLPNSVMTRTFSKLFGLAALRVGWLVAGPAIVDVLNRSRGPFNVSQPAQAAAEAAIGDLDHQALAKRHNDQWLPWLGARIAELGLDVYPSVGNFLLIGFPKEAGRDASAAQRALEAHGVIPRAMGAYGLPHCLRLSVGLEAENHLLVEALAAFTSGRHAA